MTEQNKSIKQKRVKWHVDWSKNYETRPGKKLTIYRASDISSSTFLSSKASTSITWREWICNNDMAMWINSKHLANLWSIPKDSVIKLMHSRSLRDMHPPQTIYKASHAQCGKTLWELHHFQSPLEIMEFMM